MQVSYPGVYVQEIESGTRSITGVATSVTAFVGRAARGPIDTPITIHSQSDYDRQFGGLDRNSPMSFAVRDFFLNGGATALIVRLFRRIDPSPIPSSAVLALGSGLPGFQLQAANPGRWGEKLTVTLDKDVSAATADALGVDQEALFNLTVEYKPTPERTEAIEVHRNLTVIDSPRRIDLVLLQDSQLVRWAAGVPLSTVLGDAVEALDEAIKITSLLPAPAQDGTYLDKDLNFVPTGSEAAKIGLYALEKVDGFNLLVIPPNLNPDDSIVDGNLDPFLVADAAEYCKKRRAILILDGDKGWQSKDQAVAGRKLMTASKDVALFFPRIRYPNPFNDNRFESFICGGAVAGIIARTDSERGVWKAPAGLDAVLAGVPELAVELTDQENGDLNQLGVNCLRTKAGVGRVVWGSRTLEGDDRLASEWKYLSVRRTALFIEESLFRGTEWVVFEPNDEPLWTQIRANVGAFMQGLFLQGAFQGDTPDEAYFVKCDDESTTQADIDNGIVNILVGFAPLKPAEFVVISLQQMAGQVTS